MRGIVSKMSIVSILAGALLLGQNAVAGTCEDTANQIKQARVDMQVVESTIDGLNKEINQTEERIAFFRQAQVETFSRRYFKQLVRAERYLKELKIDLAEAQTKADQLTKLIVTLLVDMELCESKST